MLSPIKTNPQLMQSLYLQKSPLQRSLKESQIDKLYQSQVLFLIQMFKSRLENNALKQSIIFPLFGKNQQNL